MRKRPKLTETQFDRFADELRAWIKENVSPFEDDTPQRQIERKARAKGDRLFFFKTYLPHYFSLAFEDFHEEWSDLADIRDVPVGIGAPREHAKSTFFSFGVPMHDCCFALRWFVMIISDTNDQATGFTMPIKIELEENPRIIHDFGKMRGRIWRDNDFTTANGVRVLARGRGEKVRGLKNRQHRPDRVIIDDLENDKNVRNPRLVKEALDWLLQAVLGSLADKYSMIMVGNLFAPRSVLSQIINAKDEEGKALYITKAYDCFREDGSPLWPELWPPERLERRRRQMGTVRFNREMRNRVGAEESPIKEEWIIYIPRIEIFVPGQWVVAAFLDPSGKSKETNDYKAIVVTGRERGKDTIECLHAWIRHATVNSMWEAAWSICGEYHCSLGVEINMFEDFLIDSYQNFAKGQRIYLYLQKVRHATDKIARIVNRIAPLAEFGKIRFIKGHSDQELLVEQLIYIMDENVNDDGPDALEGAVSMVQEGIGEIEYQSTGEYRETTGYAMDRFLRS
jgi:hypothetical protein